MANSADTLSDQPLDTGLGRGLAALNLVVNDADQARLCRFVDLLEKWNRVYNLTAITGREAMITHHLLDSLALLPWLEAIAEDQRLSVLDLGSGAGIPVLPLALLLPVHDFRSVESNGKKTRFQRQVVLELGLGNVQVMTQRVERLEAQADVVMARAYAAPERFLQQAATLCRPGGKAFVLLGRSERMPENLPSPWSLDAVHELQVPGLDAERHLGICTHA